MAEVAVALDVPGREEALALVERLGGAADVYKVGLELYTAAGPDMVTLLRERGKRVFLDLKLHDIPTTVARAVAAAARQEVEFLTLHSSGGPTMLRAAVEAAPASLRLLGVTLLTSFPAAEVESAWGRPILSLRDEVLRLAELVRDSGVAGVVASPLEAGGIRRRLGRGMFIVTPGIRLPGGETHDQTRIAEPGAAVAAGADLLVVGRAVTAAPDPVEALASIRAAMSGAGVGVE